LIPPIAFDALAEIGVPLTETPEAEKTALDRAQEEDTGREAGESKDLSAHRRRLIEADHKASEIYDKTILTLSGGALAVSFAFLKDIVPHPDPSTVWRLAWGWTALVASLVAILLSMLFGRWGLRRQVKQVDMGKIWSEHPGGWASRLTSWLNVIAAAAFVIGVGLLVWFAVANLSRLEEPMSTMNSAKEARGKSTPKPAPKPPTKPIREGYEGPPPPPPPKPKK
jgi:hypothetical protein